eukprot:2846164-Pyramimonas_sp.AAC.1
MRHCKHFLRGISKHIPPRKRVPAPCCADARLPVEPQPRVRHKEVSSDRIAFVGMGAVGG